MSEQTEIPDPRRGGWVWEWDGGRVYGEGYGGGSDPSYGCLSINGVTITVVTIRDAMMKPHAFTLELGGPGTDYSIPLGARRRETALAEAEPYIVGYLIGLKQQKDQR